MAKGINTTTKDLKTQAVVLQISLLIEHILAWCKTFTVCLAGQAERFDNKENILATKRGVRVIDLGKSDHTVDAKK